MTKPWRRILRPLEASFTAPRLFSLNLIALLFVKLSRPGDSNGTFSVFESKIEAISQPTYNPKKQQSNPLVYLHSILLMLNIKEENCKFQQITF